MTEYIARYTYAIPGKATNQILVQGNNVWEALIDCRSKHPDGLLPFDIQPRFPTIDPPRKGQCGTCVHGYTNLCTRPNPNPKFYDGPGINPYCSCEFWEDRTNGKEAKAAPGARAH